MNAVMAKRKPKPKDPETIHAVAVRMPYRLYEQLERASQEESRSVNMQILHLIREWLKTRPDTSS
jgi:hypothetical protein